MTSTEKLQLVLMIQVQQLQRQYYLLQQTLADLAGRGKYLNNTEPSNLLFDGYRFYISSIHVSTTPINTKEFIDRLFTDLLDHLNTLASKGKTVVYPDVKYSSLQRGKYRFKPKIIIDITDDFRPSQPEVVLQKVADIRQQLLDLDRQGYCLSYFDESEVVYHNGKYQILSHPFTNRKCQSRFIPLARKSLPYDIFASNGYNTVNLIEIWDTIRYCYQLQGYHIFRNINSDLSNIRFTIEPPLPGNKPKPIKTEILSSDDLVISGNGRQFYPDKIIYNGPLSTVISGILDGRPMVVKLSKKDNLFSQDRYLNINECTRNVKGRKKTKSDPLFAQNLDFIRFYLETGFKVTINGKKARIFGNVMEPLSIPVNPDIRQMAIDLITNLYLLHRHKLVHCDIKPVNVMSKDGRYVLIDFEGITCKGSPRWIFSGVTSVFNPQAKAQGFYHDQCSYRDDLIELGYTLNYFASGGKYVRNYSDPRINNYISYLFCYEIDVDFTTEDYQTMINFFS